MNTDIEEAHRQDDIRYMVDSLGCLESVAKIAADFKFGREVCRMIEDLIFVIDYGIDLRTVRSPSDFHAKTGIDTPIDLPRIRDAIAIAYKVVARRDAQ